MIVLGLGTNLGDRAAQLQRAVNLLKDILSDVHCSPVYESKALLPADAPEDWDIAYLNMAVCGKTKLGPRALLENIKAIERSLGRDKRGHWGPREIDIDILAYHEEVIDEADLHIPHKELLKRDFALVPLADVAPSWKYPLEGEYFGKAAYELAADVGASLNQTSLVIA